MSMENKKIDQVLQKMLSRGRTVIGIDIGATSVNVAQAATYQGKPTIIKAVIENIKIIGDLEQKAGTRLALTKALAGFDCANADVVCTVSNQKTVVDYITMPLMPDAELSEAIKIEINNSKHFSVDDPIFDYQVAGRVINKNVEKINIKVAIVGKSAITSLLAHFRPLEQSKFFFNLRKFLRAQDFMGLNLVKIIPISIALENVIKKLKLRTHETLVVLEIGSVSGELNVFRDGNLEFSRKINVTGFDFTRSLTSALSTSMGKVELTLQEAEWVKKEFGIPSASEEYLIKDKITANQAISLLRPKLEQLIKEITRSFDFYYDKNRTAKLDRLILLGGGTMLKRLPEFLNAELGIPVGLGNSLEDVDLLYEGMLDHLQDKHRMILAMGAALSDVRGINLLPESLRDSKKKFAQKLLMGAAGIVLVVVSIFIYIVLLIRLNGIQQESVKLENEYYTFTPAINDLKNKLLLQSLSNQRLDLGGVLRELSYLPDKVYLSDLTLENGDLTLSGFVLARTRDARKILRPLIAELKNASLRDVKIATMAEESKAELNTSFIIKAHLGSTGGGQ